MTKQPSYLILSAEQAEQKYSTSQQITYPYLDFTDQQEILLYQGDTLIEGDFLSERDTDWNSYNVIVDGNLTVTENIDWSDFGGSFLLVTGNVKAKNLFIQGCPNVVIQGELTMENSIFGFYGDDGGTLVVKGNTQTPLLINMTYFNMTFSLQPKALVVGDPDRTDCEVDFTDKEFTNILLPDFVKKGEYTDNHKIKQALAQGQKVLRSHIELAIL